jgi:hypothetical protein
MVTAAGMRSINDLSLDRAVSYYQITSTSTTFATSTDTLLVVTPNVTGTDPVMLQFCVGTYCSALSQRILMSLVDVTAGGIGAGAIDLFDFVVNPYAAVAGTNSLLYMTGGLEVPAPPVGQRTYKLFMWTNTGTATLYASPAGNASNYLEALRK